jgi:hypothetical protein
MIDTAFMLSSNTHTLDRKEKFDFISISVFGIIWFFWMTLNKQIDLHLVFDFIYF